MKPCHLPLIIMTLLLLRALPAFAEETAAAPDEPQSPTINIRLSDEMKQAMAAYKNATENLTPEQLEILAKLDEELAATMDPDVQIIDIGARLSACVEPGRELEGEAEKYIAAFKALRDKKNREQEALWAKHNEMRTQADFIDKTVLTNHFTVQKMIMLQLIGGTIKVAVTSGEVDCGKVREELAEYMQP